MPIGPVRVEAEVVRPGRRVQLIEASLSGEDGVLVRARGWRIRTTPIDLPESIEFPAPPPGPEQGSQPEFFATGQDVGYHTAMEWRSVGGGFLEPGPATVWMRMRRPLVDGEEPTPLQRTLIAADVGNGISAVLDWKRYLFINVDLSVHLERMPEGEWVCVDAVTLPQPNGIGTAESVLSDRARPDRPRRPDPADRRARLNQPAGERAASRARLCGRIVSAIVVAETRPKQAAKRKAPS